jgi:uncharacterized protein YaaQ
MMNNGGPGMNNGGGFGIGGATGFVNITEEEAVAKVQAYIDSNQLKGYTVNGTSSFVSPRGFDSYIVKVSDNGGNNFVFMVGARGFVRGPILESNFNAWQQPAPIPAPAQ